jgi:hypothetical protein
MTEEAKLINELAPIFAYLIAAILLIIFVRKYLFVGMISIEMHNAQIAHEKEIVRTQEEVSNHLSEIVAQLSNLTASIKEEIGGNTERLRSLEMAMSDYLQAFHELNHNFELHRRGYTDTEQLRVIK